MKANDFRDKLTKLISQNPALYGIGQTGDLKAPLVSKIISLVKKHPSEFFKAWYNNEESRIIDEEDLGRSELRHEVLFFHQVVEEFLDHFLQALYALNNQYFPSRKRTEKAVEGFKLMPENCTARLEHIVTLAANEETIPQAVVEIRKIGAELKALWE